MKVGYELELIAPPGHTRYTIAKSFAEKYQFNLNACFHRESELWPGGNDTPYYCLTKGFELSHHSNWQLRFINDMTIRKTIDSSVVQSSEWYHVLTDDIRLIDLIYSHCDPHAATEQILLPMAQLFKTELESKDGIFTVTGKKSSLICGAHSQMTDRNRICEIVTAPITEDHHSKLEKIISLAQALGCMVPQEGAFHIHFDGTSFANSSTLLRAIRYFYVWSDVLKTIIPPNPYCTRLGDYDARIVSYAFQLENEKKEFAQVVNDLKGLGATKYCDFNFSNILIGNPDKFTFEVRTIPMMLNADALNSAYDLFSSFINFICSTKVVYQQDKIDPSPDNISLLVQSL